MSKKFECCHYCTPPKRHIGCHMTCSDYLDEVEANEREKLLLARQRDVERYTTEAKYRMKKRRKHHA